MAILTIRDVPYDVRWALCVQAARLGCSMEAWVRDLLARAVKPQARVRMGDAPAGPGHRIGLIDEDFEGFEWPRDRAPAKPLVFD